MNDFYIYVYLDNRKPGAYSYKELNFDFQPFYFGKGKGRRIQQHLQPNHLNSNTIKTNTIIAIQKETGEDPTHFKVYEGLSFEEVNEIEIDIITHFGRRDNNTGFLANMTGGGEGFKDMVFSDETRKKMSEKAKGSKTYANNGQSKIVERLNVEGEVIKTYQSLREAAEDVDISFKTISNWCRGVCKPTDGHLWRYAGKSYKPKIKPQVPSRRKKVYQYELDGTYVGEWPSMSEVKQELKLNHVSCVCLGKLSSCGGFQWRYEKVEKLPELRPISTKLWKFHQDKKEKRIKNMTKIIRQEVFENNSSSSHNLSMRQNTTQTYDTLPLNEEGDIVLEGGEFGWEWRKYTDSLTKANYCAVYLAYKKDFNKDYMFKQMLLDHTGANKLVLNFTVEGYGTDEDVNWSYVDHQSMEGGHTQIEELFKDFETDTSKVKNWIFGGGVLFTGNDNDYPPSNFYDLDVKYTYTFLLDGTKEPYMLTKSTLTKEELIPIIKSLFHSNEKNQNVSYSEQWNFVYDKNYNIVLDEKNQTVEVVKEKNIYKEGKYFGREVTETKNLKWGIEKL